MALVWVLETVATHQSINPAKLYFLNLQTTSETNSLFNVWLIALTMFTDKKKKIDKFKIYTALKHDRGKNKYCKYT